MCFSFIPKAIVSACSAEGFSVINRTSNKRSGCESTIPSAVAFTHKASPASSKCVPHINTDWTSLHFIGICPRPSPSNIGDFSMETADITLSQPTRRDHSEVHFSFSQETRPRPPACLWSLPIVPFVINLYPKPLVPPGGLTHITVINMVVANASLSVPSQSYGVGLDYHDFIARSSPLGRKEAITATSIRNRGNHHFKHLLWIWAVIFKSLTIVSY